MESNWGWFDWKYIGILSIGQAKKMYGFVSYKSCEIQNETWFVNNEKC